MTAKKARPKPPKTTTYVFKGDPITAEEVRRLRDRLIGQAEDVKGMQHTVMYRLAIDADHLALLMDRAAGQERFEMWVQVKPKTKRDAAKLAKAAAKGAWQKR